MISPQSQPSFEQATFDHRRTFPFLIVALLLLATWLRFDGLFGGGLHPDEALFASWARTIGTWRDPLLQLQGVDKPPLFFYLQAALFPLLGSAELWVTRLLNVVASLLLVPLVVQLVLAVYRDRLAALLAGALVVFSPLAVRLGGSAFLDPLLTSLLLAALWASVRAEGPAWRKHVVAGLLFGLAAATKYQAWLFLPLPLAIGLFRAWSGRQWRSWLTGLAIPLALVASWIVVRGGESLWAQQMAGFGGLRPAWSWELWPRLEAWGEIWMELAGSPLIAFLALLALPIYLATLISEQEWSTVYDHLFLIFVASYAALHWFLAVPIWDRYLLPVLPLAAVIFGRFVSRVLAFLAPGVPVSFRHLQQGVAIGALLLLLVPAMSVTGVNEARTGDDGVAAVARLLAGEPYGTVLYDHWYSWQWRYFLFDSGVYVSWYPHPAALVEDLNVFSGEGGRRYLVLPDDARALPVQRALTAAGFVLETKYDGGGVALFLIRGGAS